MFQAPDATPLLEVETQKAQVVLDLRDSILELVKGLPADQRTIVEVELAKQMAAYAKLQESTEEFLVAVASVDFQVLYGRLKELYDQIRASGAGN